MSKRLGPHQLGGVFYLYTLKGIDFFSYPARDKKLTLLPTGKAVTAYASGFSNAGG